MMEVEMLDGSDTRGRTHSAERVLETAWLIAQSPLFLAPVVVAALLHAVAGPDDQPWLLASILTPFAVGAAALVRALLRRRPALGQLALLALTLVFLYLLFMVSFTGDALFSDAASSVSNAPAP